MADEPTSTDTVNPDPTPGDKADAKFTQADLDKAIGDRLAREQKKWQRQLTAESEKARVEAVEKFREEHDLDDEKLAKALGGDTSKVELTKIKGKLTKTEKALAAMEEKHSVTAAKLRSSLVADKLLREAAGKFNDPTDAVRYLENEFLIEDDFSVHHIGPNGEPSGKEVTELLTELLEKKPYLAPPTGNRGAGSRAGDPGKAGGKEPKPGERGYLAHIFGGGGG